MKKIGERRVAITGIGVLSSVGHGKEDYWNALKNGRSGIRPITTFNAETLPMRVAGEIEGFDPQKFMPYELTRRLDRFALLGLAAAKQALEDAHLPIRFSYTDAERTCVRIGTVIGALGQAEETHSLFLEKGFKRVHPFFSSLVLPSSLASQIGIMCGIHGSISTIVSACVSGTVAIGDAFRLVRDGQYDIAIAGASEAPITPLVMASFASLGLLASQNDDPDKLCRPFSKNRSGIVLAEGAAVLILEEMNRAKQRKARIYGEILGCGESFDSYHTHQPLPSADYCAAAISSALTDASLRPEEIDYINPHGSGSILNDKAETLAIKKVFGHHAYKLSLSSTKSMIGHTLGACGALEMAACALMLEHQFVHPTINLVMKDPDCDLDFVPNVGCARSMSRIVSMSAGFGGYNAACVIGLA